MRDLIDAARHGGRAELDALLRAVWPHAYRIAYSVIADRALAEDAAQESCAILVRSLKQLRSTDAFRVWFYRIVVRQSVALVRSREAMLTPLDDAQSDDLSETVLRIDVLRALAALSPEQRTAIALSVYAGLNSREIAEIVGTADSTVRFHLMKAKRTLEQLLAQEVPFGAA